MKPTFTDGLLGHYQGLDFQELKDGSRLTLLALALEPRLNSHGIGRPPCFSGVDDWSLEGCRAELIRDYPMVAKCALWIRKFCRPTKTIRDRGSTSYGLKHAASKWLRGARPEVVDYVHNGAFIAAAIALGYRMKPVGLNAYFNLKRIDQ
jgi:hypothetical protein